MMADFEPGNAWLLSGNVVNARTAADDFLKPALSTSDPHLQALGWELQARVALAESDLQGARESIQKALAIIDRFEILFAAWQVFATASQVYKYAKEIKTAEAYRDRAESCILQIADSFEANEPLRATFLAATPVGRILREKVVDKGKRHHGLRRVGAP